MAKAKDVVEREKVINKINIDRLSTVADILDEHFLEIYHLNHTLGFYVRWSAEEIRKVLREER